MRPCNKLPTVQARCGYKMHFRLLPKQMTYISPVGEGLAPPEILVIAAHPSIAKKRDLREPSPAGEHVAKRLSSLQANVEGTACGG